FAYTVDGLLGGSTALAGVTCGVAGPHAAAGTYPIGCSGASDPDYVVDSYLTSTLTVTPAPLVVPVRGSQTYGGAPGYVADLAAAGLVDGDTPAVVGGVLSCTTTATAGSGVGSYPITGCSGLSAANYSIGYTYGSVQVTPRPVTVRADDRTKVAGEADPAFTYSTVPAGLTLAGVTCGVAGAHDVASSYDITCTTTTDPNYTQTSVPGTLTVTAPPAVCGNAVPEAGEVCDDGNTVTESGTCPYGQATCVPACTATCDAVVARSSGGVCGDGTTQAPAEVCDDGNTTTETSCPYGDATCSACNSTCSAALDLTGGYCGDTVQQAGEFCDDGNTVSETSCPYGQATCTACNSTCSGTLSLSGGFCGDASVTDGEECDDGNAVDGDACSNTCELPSG
ncbi:MAG TPA: MBG domain-containing protein, partial [Nocardioides sp.]|nr:MBG domain-containing protein [Nocardioides sp.]